MNYYSFHIGDFITATVHLSPMEELAYRRLLDMYYDTESQIPLETHSVSRRLRMDTEIVDSVLNEFFTRTETGWANHRCDAEIAAYHRKVDANRSNGKLGGRPKKTQSVNLANPVESQQNLNQEPITNNQEPVLKPLRRKSAPMPSDFALNETSEAYAQARNLQVTAELASFKNWHTAKGSSFKDWQAAWRTWCDKAVEFGRSKTVVPAFGKQANRDSYAAQAAQAAAKLNIGERNERTDERDITEYCSRVA